MDTAAIVVSSLVAGLVVIVTLALFLWAAREDGRAQRREDERLGIVRTGWLWRRPMSRRPR